MKQYVLSVYTLVSGNLKAILLEMRKFLKCRKYFTVNFYSWFEIWSYSLNWVFNYILHCLGKQLFLFLNFVSCIVNDFGKRKLLLTSVVV